MKKFFVLLLLALILATGWKVYEKVLDPASGFSRRRMKQQVPVEITRIRLSYTQIKILWNASGTGMVVGQRFVDEGALLSPNAQIVSVLDISSLIAVINVTERDYFKLKTGQIAVIKADALGKKQFKGRITRISPLIKETSREAKVEIEIPNIKRELRPGLFIRAMIHFDTHGDSQIVPLTALAKRNNTVGVFLADLENKKAIYIPVEVGITENNQVEIIKPVLQGFVVTLGQHLLEDKFRSTSAVTIWKRQNAYREEFNGLSKKFQASQTFV